MRKNLQREIQNNPGIALLNIMPKRILVNKINLMGNLFTAARMLIAMAWKEEKTLEIRIWLRKV